MDQVLPSVAGAFWEAGTSMSLDDRQTLYWIREQATGYLHREDRGRSIVSLKIDLDEIARLADGALSQPRLESNPLGGEQ